MSNWQRVTLLGALALAATQPLNAATDEEVIATLQAQIVALSQRLDQAEARSRLNQSETQSRLDKIEALGLDQIKARAQIYERTYAAQQIAASSDLPSSSSWTDRIQLNGDMRYRHETIDAENSSERNRQRIRARTHLKARVNDSVTVGFGLATGGDDPVSSNQTLGNGLSSKSVRIDLAYFDWTTPVEGLSVIGGKFENPFRRAGSNGLLWDSDLRPEGAALTFNRGALTATVVGLWTEESATEDDTFALASQLDWRHALGDDVGLLAGIGYYNFVDVKGEPALFDRNPRGNSVDAAGNYLFGFEEVEAFAELSFNIAELPVTLFADYVRNLDAGDFDTGYAIGGKISLRAGSRPLQLAYIYQDLEADAVLGLLTDSDFVGGGTDGKGHILKIGYPLTDKISLRGTLFLNERDGNLGTEEDYDRLQLDVSFKY